MSDNMPLELLEKILIMLPVKSLVQFRSVSKAWKCLIDSSDFIAAQSRYTQPEHLLIRYEHPFDSTKEYVSYIDNIKENYVSVVDNQTFPQQKSSPALHRLVEHLKDSRVVGSSHGLFCIYGDHLIPDVSPHRYISYEIAVIWNPSIRKLVAIDVPNAWSDKTVVGFGVSPVNNDPKIITIRQCCYKYDDILPWEVEVYSLSSGKWRTLSSNLPCGTIKVTWSQVAIGNFIYWSAYYGIYEDMVGISDDYVIIAFDTTNECFRVIELPDSFGHEREVPLFVSKLNESLVVLDNNERYMNTITSIWMLEDCGGEKSFTMLYAIYTPYMSMRILGFRKSGGPIMEVQDLNGGSFDEAALFVLEPDEEQPKGLGIHGKEGSITVDSYAETLLLVNQPNSYSY